MALIFLNTFNLATSSHHGHGIYIKKDFKAKEEL